MAVNYSELSIIENIRRIARSEFNIELGFGEGAYDLFEALDQEEFQAVISQCNDSDEAAKASIKEIKRQLFPDGIMRYKVRVNLSIDMFLVAKNRFHAKNIAENRELPEGYVEDSFQITDISRDITDQTNYANANFSPASKLLRLRRRN